jgi:hypothetical protein
MKKDSSAQGYAKFWWQYARKGKELYGAIAECVGAASPKENRILVIPLVSKFFNCTWEPVNFVYSHALGVISTDKDATLTILQSNIHEEWARSQGSTLETRMRYTPSDCFETFPFPDRTDTLEAIGERYYTHRQTIMQTRQQGLTKTYNRFHDPTCTDPDIQTLRDLHIQMDKAVAAAYGWHDLISPRSPGRGAGGEGLNHDFHDTKQGLRFTISETARREILDRLLALNHQRYAEEVALGLHDKKKGKGKGKIQKAKGKKPPAENPAPDNGQHTVQGSLFGDDGPTQGELF